jgi:hypothetical protein
MQRSALIEGSSDWYLNRGEMGKPARSDVSRNSCCEQENPTYGQVVRPYCVRQQAPFF